MPALASLRSDFHFDLGFVSRQTGLSRARLQELESNATPTFFEAERLASLYGLDADEVFEDEPLEHGGLRLLTLRAEFKSVGAETRRRIVEAAAAARDLRRLEMILEVPDPREAFRRRAKQVTQRKPPRTAEAPFVEGAEIAKLVRKQAGLGKKPIPSLRDLVANQFPEIRVLYANLGDGPSGLTFEDSLRGVVIVLNLRGQNRNPLVRRFSLGHELAHTLMDTRVGQPLAEISIGVSDAALPAEQRANAFALRLLCPEAIIREAAGETDPTPTIRKAVSEFGVHYSAVRNYLCHTAGFSSDQIPVQPPPTLALELDASRWMAGEEPVGLDAVPLEGIPPERRTSVCKTACIAYSRSLIARDELAEVLRLDPSADLESLMDFYALDVPSNE